MSYRREMDAILEKNADKDIRHTKRQQLRKAHEKMAATPRKADKFLGTIGMLWNYGKLKLDWPLGDNPSEGIDRFGKQKEFEPWPEWMLNKLQSADTVVQQAAFLILNTGQRPNAAITMQWSQFTNGEMSLTDEKGDVIFDVHCPEPLQKFLSNTPKKGRYIIAKNLTEGLGYNAIEKRFRTWRAKLGPEAKKFSLHGLRKLAIIHLAEAGATDAQIQSITNQSSETIAYYRRLASRKKLSKAAFNKRDNNT